MMTPVSPSKLPVISVHILQMKKIQHRKRYLKKHTHTHTHKIQTNIEKSLGDSLNIHLQQQMGSFQASMLEAFSRFERS